jgi:hypothetical protein
LLNKKSARALLFMTLVLLVLSISHQSAYAQFIPCKIVTFNPVPPTLVQSGQPFQVTTDLTVSCDPSVLPVIRIDVIDATTSQTLSTNSVPYYPTSSSFTASVVNQLTARQLTGSWALQDQAYVLNGIDGRSVASTAQLFQVNVQPYTPLVTEMQTTETTTQISNSTLAVATSPLPTTTALQNITQTTTSFQTQLAESTQATNPSTNQLLLPAAILLVGLVAFGLLMTAASRRKRSSPPKNKCGQCGTELNQHEKYCTHCGAKQNP